MKNKVLALGKSAGIRHALSLQIFPKWEILFFLILVLGMLILSWSHNDHHLIYPLDDTYIHLAIAKQLSENGSWGLTEGRFDFSSSGPLFTMIVAGIMKVFGNSPHISLIINLLSGIFIIVFVNSILVRYSIPSKLTFRLITGFILLTPLPLLVVNGMEHCLQVWIDLGFVWVLAERLSRKKGSLTSLLLLAVFAGIIRYEGIFLIGIGSLALFFRKDFKTGTGVLVVGFLPIMLLGLFSISQGGTFFPISVLGKGHLPGFSLYELLTWFQEGFLRLWENPFVPVTMGVLCVILAELFKVSPKNISFYFILVTVLVSLAHSFAAEIGGYRYEAYLIALSLLGIIIGTAELHWWKITLSSRNIRRMGFQILVGMSLLSLVVRSGYFHYYYPRATQNIYHQQYQMARFLKDNFPDASVAVNDIGAVTYFTDIQLTDLVGIGDQFMYQLRKKQNWNMETIHEICAKREVDLAIVHDIWVGSVIPKNWEKIGEWIIPDNFICADERVSFYVVNKDKAEKINKLFKDFSGRLPEGVDVVLF